ncbi:hypothetical protein IscW_ISCW004694 [Ixodes scapularis]|uniref:Uncharacterized protein n=1 Tax=Ixodes scapularis TaxID=6945 RepID=B7PF72_IXOSC|nr:hypothetical protein IscW_ISCW004694 [Ixodes scapularis]|eukprot:XP_002433844.1 hypothetical protein IscW_ISCW004694 [Ixodes scapularis]
MRLGIYGTGFRVSVADDEALRSLFATKTYSVSWSAFRNHRQCGPRRPLRLLRGLSCADFRVISISLESCITVHCSAGIFNYLIYAVGRVLPLSAQRPVFPGISFGAISSRLLSKIKVGDMACGSP